MVFKCHLILYYATTTNHFLGGYDMTECWFYTTTGNDHSSVFGLRRSFKALPKVKLIPKKIHGHCLVVCCSSVPVLKTGTPLTLELQCQGDIGQQKGPNSSAQKCLITCCITNTSKVEWIGLRSFASSSIFTWPFTNYHFFKQLENFCKDCFHNQQDAENTF